MAEEREYVLGTHDVEVRRLALQHRVWRERSHHAWRRAGFAAGQSILDLGCGPGFASLDLAVLAGPAGRVTAIDQSARFLGQLQDMAREHGRSNLTTLELDLDAADGALPAADAAWARWVFAFVRDPRRLVQRLADALPRGGVLAIHEYFDYAAWRVSPREPDFEGFVAEVIGSWRAAGGEPDIGLDLPRWLEDAGFELQPLRTHVDLVAPGSDGWHWLAAFVQSGIDRLASLGTVAPARAEAMRRAHQRAVANPQSLMVTPAVLEIVARRW
jgi:SAM-dependent methyltransferase